MTPDPVELCTAYSFNTSFQINSLKAHDYQVNTNIRIFQFDDLELVYSR